MKLQEHFLSWKERRQFKRWVREAQKTKREEVEEPTVPFCLPLAPDVIVTDLSLAEERAFYDETWKVCGTDHDVSFVLFVVRSWLGNTRESKKELRSAIEGSCRSPKDILGLDERRTICYD